MKILASSLSLILLASPAAAQDGEVETIELMPEEKAGWSLRNVAAGFSTVVVGPSYWYEDKELLVQTVPDGAQLALYYIRSNFQKRYERAVAPVRIKTPRRIHATDRDVVVVRAMLPGYLVVEQKFRVFDLPDEVLLQLAPLPNSLVFLGYTHIAGRSTITLRTSEEPELRISRPNGRNGFSLALTQTAKKLDSDPTASGGHIESIHVNQLGEDLVVSVDTRRGDLELRSKSAYDPIRKEHAYVLDVMPKGTRMPTSNEIRREIEGVDFQPGSACDAAFEAVLRERLDGQVLARAFRPSGGIAEFYQREAMLRLGRTNTGRVETLGGEGFRTGSSIELTAALQSAGEVRDYLALLGTIARQQPDPEGFMRALVAPEGNASEFAEIYAAALAARSQCR
jgi:hypothetical protein